MSEEPTKQSSTKATSSFARTARLAVVILVLLLGSLGVWIWLSSAGDANLPFQYGGFD